MHDSYTAPGKRRQSTVNAREKRSNEEWIAAVRAGDADALGDLRAYLCRSLEKALAGRSGQAEAEDFAQQALMRIAERIDSFRGDSAFTTWSAAIALRIAFSELRRKRWGDVSLDGLVSSGVEPSAPARESGGASARAELVSALTQGIETALSERQRAVILAELRGMPTAVIAREMGMTANALYKMHHDGRKKLLRYLEESGFQAEDVRFALQGASQVR